MIQPTENSLDPIYSFPDALVQEVAYDSLLVQSRKQLHRRLGETLEMAFADHIEAGVDLMAFHYSRSDDEEKAIKFIELAAKKARNDFATETAIQYYTMLLEILRRRSDPEAIKGQANALYQMGVMAYEAGDYNRAQPWLEEAEQIFSRFEDARNVGWSIMYRGMVELKRGTDQTQTNWRPGDLFDRFFEYRQVCGIQLYACCLFMTPERGEDRLCRPAPCRHQKKGCFLMNPLQCRFQH